MENNEKREAITINLKPEARERMDRVREETGVPKTEALARIVEWFMGLDRKLRLAVLNNDAETRRELTRLVLSEMAGVEQAQPGAVDAPVTEEQAVRVMRSMLDQLERLRVREPVLKHVPGHGPGKPGRVRR